MLLPLLSLTGKSLESFGGVVSAVESEVADCEGVGTDVDNVEDVDSLTGGWITS